MRKAAAVIILSESNLVEEHIVNRHQEAFLVKQNGKVNSNQKALSKQKLVKSLGEGL